MYEEETDTKKVGFIAGLVVLIGLFLASSKTIAENATPVNFGNTVLGSIDPVGDTDTYTFSANAGDTVLIRMSEASSSLYPEVRLYAPDGNEVGGGWDSTTAERSYTLADAGEYTVLAFDHYGTNTGDYGIFVQRLNNPGNATAINFGQTISGSIDSDAEMDTYTFSANANDNVLVRMSEASISLYPEVRLYAPDGSELGEAWDSTTAERSYTLADDGEYTVLAFDHYGTHTGDYGIFVQRLNNPGNATAINFGDTSPGFVASVGEMDTYTFSANAGDSIVIAMSVDSGSLDPEIRLYAPDGAELAVAHSYGDTVEISYIMADDGTYTILVCDYGGTDTGNYTLSLSMQIFEQLTPGEPYVGNISTGDWHSFYVEVQADTNLLVTLEPVSSTAIFELYGRYGQPPTQSDCDYVTKKKNIFGNYELLISPTQSGTYFFAVYGRDIGGTTDYQITASIVNQHVSDVYPRTAASSTGTAVHIVGLDFTNGMQVELRNTSGLTILSETVVVSSPTMIIARFDLSSAPLGLYNIFVIWPDGYEKMIEGAIEVKELQEGAIYAFDVNIDKGSSVTYDIVVQGGTQNLFITLQKTNLVSYGNSWRGTLSLLYNGGEIASTNGSHDLILHVVEPTPGDYTVEITADQTGSGILTVWAALPELPLGDWVVGKIYCSYGSIWYQVDVPPAQDQLLLEAEAMGLWSHFDIYYGQYGSPDHWVSPQGTRTSLEIPNPEPGIYIVEFLDSAMIHGDSGWAADQSRDVLLKADTVVTTDPDPDYVPTITNVSPDKGGNTGFVTVTIEGGWLDPNATVSLVRAGQPVITAMSVYGEPDQTTLTATFDLTDQKPGESNLVVTNPDGQRATAPGPFTIEQGGEPELWVEIVGREKVRVGRQALYIFIVGNSGNINLNYVIPIIHVPEGADVVSLKSIPEEELLLDGDELKTYNIRPDNIPLWITELGPGETQRFELILDITSESSELGITGTILGGMSCFAKNIVQAYTGDEQIDAVEFLNAIVETSKSMLESGLQTLVAYALGPATGGATIAFSEVWGTTQTLVTLTSAAGQLIEHSLRHIELEYVFSTTPEDKYGPVGFDMPGTPTDEWKRFVRSDHDHYFRVDFWNKEDATAPAYDVLVEDQLDSNLDWGSFRFEDAGFLKWNVDLEPCQYFNVDVDTRPDMDWIVNVEGTFDPETGKVTWWFRTLDPNTHETPADPMAGFLPPITESGEEIGWVGFTVRPKTGLATGTQIANQAFVEFDHAGDLHDHPAPKEGPWINTLDAKGPTSQVSPLPETIETRSFLIEWSGQDDLNGSGIYGYDIYVSTDSSDYVLWLANATDTSGTFIGEGGHTYSFYSRVRDNVGHVEPAPDSPDSTTTSVWITGDFCGPNFGPSDGYVDVWDLMQFADHWHTRNGDPDWDSKFDLTGPNFGDLDGYVDVWDLMVFADHWHEGVKP